MALTREEQQIALRVTGQLEIEELNRRLAQEREELRLLVPAHASLVQSRGANDAAVLQLESHLGPLTQSLRANEEALRRAQAANRSYAQNMTALSYVANDFLSVNGGIQQRLNAIANNMPMLLAGFGMLGPILSGLLPALGMFAANFDNIKKAMGFEDGSAAFKTAIDRIKEHVKTLESKPVKLAVDTLELRAAKDLLDGLESGLKAFDRLQKMTTGLQKQSGTAVTQAISETEKKGGTPLSDQLGAQQFNALQNADPELAGLHKQVRDARSGIRDGVQYRINGDNRPMFQAREQAALDKVQARLLALQEQANAEIGQLTDQAMNGDENAQTQLVRRLRALGRHNLADQVEAASPARLKKAAKDEIAREENVGGIIRRNVLGPLIRGAGALGQEMERRRNPLAPMDDADRADDQRKKLMGRAGRLEREEEERRAALGDPGAAGRGRGGRPVAGQGDDQADDGGGAPSVQEDPFLHAPNTAAGRVERARRRRQGIQASRQHRIEQRKIEKEQRAAEAAANARGRAMEEAIPPEMMPRGAPPNIPAGSKGRSIPAQASTGPQAAGDMMQAQLGINEMHGHELITLNSKFGAISRALQQQGIRLKGQLAAQRTTTYAPIS